MGLDFGRHADFDVFGFGIGDVDAFGQSAGEAVAPDGDDAVEHELAAVKDDDDGVVEANFNKSDEFLGKGFRFGHFKGVEGANKSGDDLVGKEAGEFDGGLKFV